MTQTKTIHALLAEVVAELKTLKESGYNSFSKYSYATDQDVLNALKVPLAERGMFLIVSQEGDAIVEFREMEKGLYSIATVHVIATIYSSTVEYITFRASGFATDKNGDKALYKALTGARKYALRLGFGLATGDDAEQDDGNGSAKSDVKQNAPAQGGGGFKRRGLGATA